MKKYIWHGIFFFILKIWILKTFIWQNFFPYDYKRGQACGKSPVFYNLSRARDVCSRKRSVFEFFSLKVNRKWVNERNYTCSYGEMTEKYNQPTHQPQENEYFVVVIPIRTVRENKILWQWEKIRICFI